MSALSRSDSTLSNKSCIVPTLTEKERVSGLREVAKHEAEALGASDRNVVVIAAAEVEVQLPERSLLEQVVDAAAADAVAARAAARARRAAEEVEEVIVRVQNSLAALL